MDSIRQFTYDENGNLQYETVLSVEKNNVSARVLLYFYKNDGECVKKLSLSSDKLKTYDMSEVLFDYIEIQITRENIDLEPVRSDEWDVELVPGCSEADIWFYDSDNSIIDHKCIYCYGREQRRRYRDVKSCNSITVTFVTDGTRF